VSQLQSVSHLVAIGSRVIAIGSCLVAGPLGLLAIGSRRVTIGLSSCNWFSCEVATAGSVHLLYIMHLRTSPDSVG
jgi:hypothetical protein